MHYASVYLPSEIDVLFFDKFYVNDILRARAVCKRWEDCSRSNVLWSNLYARFLGGVPPSFDIEKRLLICIEAGNKFDDEMDKLLWAIDNGFLLVISNILSANKCWLHIHNEDEQVIFHEAAKSGYLEEVTLLIQMGVDIDIHRSDGVTALYTAANLGHLDIVKVLLQNNADTEIGFLEQYTPLYMACQKGYYDIVKELIKYKANISVTCLSGSTPLYIASQEGNKEVVDLLLSNGADVNIEYNDGFTPLYVASRNGHTDIVRKLVEYGSNVDAIVF
eukprot:TRINITY_DN5147_c0_g2_i1.p1 TRINITY_DN5147_c0_g2~~TRINITY_DN5147_c0_g2_i1.p1  ORF type:complete len:277 (+),score=54.23 TRINITY_DN5147_c0_g2_i1:56-886(+)